MIFKSLGGRGVPKDIMDRIDYGYEAAISEMDRLLKAIDGKPEYQNQQAILLDCRGKISNARKNISPNGEDFTIRLEEVQDIEPKIDEIAQMIFPYDEARVGELFFARDALIEYNDRS